jgi:hypothetical protein
MRPAHDLSNLIKWLSREDWWPLLEEVMDEHFGPAMEAFNLEFEEIDEALGGNWAITLWGCAFEDFLTRRFEPDGRNPVEAYLQRRSWKVEALERLPVETIVLDGEAVCLLEDGRPDFHALRLKQACRGVRLSRSISSASTVRISAARRAPAAPRRAARRRDRRADVLEQRRRVRRPGAVPACLRDGPRGDCLQAPQTPYRSGRSTSWRKIKCPGYRRP